MQAFDFCAFAHLWHKCSLRIRSDGKSIGILPRRDLMMMIILSFLHAVQTHLPRNNTSISLSLSLRIWMYLFPHAISIRTSWSLESSKDQWRHLSGGENLSLTHRFLRWLIKREWRGGSSFVCAHSARDQRTCANAAILLTFALFDWARECVD